MIRPRKKSQKAKKRLVFVGMRLVKMYASESWDADGRNGDA